MLNRDRTGLIVFDEFRRDASLPKFRDTRKKLDLARRYVDMISVSEGEYEGELALSSSERPAPRPSFWGRVRSWFSRRPEPRPTMTVEEFFSDVKNTASELEVVQERARGYERALRAAREAGQVAFAEQLQDGLQAFRAEAQLVAAGLPLFIEEAKVVEFAAKSPRGIRLDWIRNFTRQIPDDVLARKRRLDELEVFDNYAVMHYDPDGKSVADTKAEAAARKDPILFGLMRGRRVLYFVGDWVDEYCDLTLDQFADAMGRESVASLESLPDPYRDPA
jgi:hypothetical protein